MLAEDNLWLLSGSMACHVVLVEGHLGSELSTTGPVLGRETQDAWLAAF